MPRDVPLHDGLLLDEDLDRSSSSGRGARGSALREAALKREVARLTRERDRPADAQ